VPRTTPRQFRLAPDTLAELDMIAAHLCDRDGVPRSRADAIRYAARLVYKKLRRKPKKNSQNNQEVS
jgi:hypothetical protein